MNSRENITTTKNKMGTTNKSNRQPLNMGPRALLDTLETDKVKDQIETLFTQESLKEIIGEAPMAVAKRCDVEPKGGRGGKREGAGRKSSPKGKRYNTGRIKEILEKVEGDRVVPIYDAYDPINGGVEFLTPMEHRFAIAYVETANATRAAEIASLNSKVKNQNSGNFRRIGCDLLRRPSVRIAIGQMQKKVCVAAALDAAEVISNIREIAALSLVDGKYEAALKANIQLGEYLGMFGKTKEERMKTVSGPGVVVEVFKSGEELQDTNNDIKKLTQSLGLNPGL